LAVRADAEVVNTIPLTDPICRDPDDDLILAVARGAKIDVLVTGDQDLLVLKEFEGIPILNPRDCLILLANN
jgi:predicted nucleic acid-binding protein